MAPRVKSSEQLLVPWIYDTLLAIFRFCLSIFFREVYAPGAWRIPKKGPVIIVAAPHANQFVDSILLMRILKRYAGRRISFLIAEKSMREPYIGTLAAQMGALPVTRAMDNIKPGMGTIFLPHPESDPTLVSGKGTNFTDPMFMERGTLILPKVGQEAPEQQAIAEIIGPEELRLKAPFKNFARDHPLYEGLRTGTSFKVAPHIDQSQMFDAVYRGLESGGCIGIFPEGGSHDRPRLLPLKAGAAIIALGTLARSPDCGLTIIPCGMNYFHPNKFRSRAVIEFGPPVEVHPDQVAAFKLGGNSKRNAVGSLLETIQEALDSVTQQAPDRESLMLIQATRKLYQPLRMKLPLPVVIELNRRLLKGYTTFRHEPKVIQLARDVRAYNRQLKALGVQDHQVEWGNVRRRPWSMVLLTLLYRIGELIMLGLGTLPSLALFWPVFVTARAISHSKQRKALANSSVKMDGRDVVGSWKILVAMGFAPALYTWYTVIVTVWLYYCRNDGYYSSVVPWWINARSYVPDSVPLRVFTVFFFGLMIAVSFAGLRIGEIGMDILKSLPPLFIALNPSSSSALIKLRNQRRAVVAQVINVINTFGPEIFPDFEYEKLVDENYDYDGDKGVNMDYATYKSRLKSMPPSEPQTPNRSRSRSRSRGRRPSDSWQGFSSGNFLKPLTSGASGPSKDELRELNRRIGTFSETEQGRDHN
ncbi:glycerol-3-phosphate O-acyltransferase, putative [Talaromyces stipitatus ATCC 10500]|uniref:Glycerol-3-phosphate O-acyltransferase, putative n=1 Tax=Talaromyces stipitatus (strain ATCC 10500 / CBS 375.48 / QM 6759 / NRRL 1006) TaxID=441959 RepID=B8M596_TALSN|nr:glycerol-3-phosphate O-acyltransferase, putative [Talaromyces stipitatus ATCC 10500]EED19702.1 glycerol-3-phosphate O-acyltransferase, putative [Talaromyces stipitatus ATCC 10500]